MKTDTHLTSDELIALMLMQGRGLNLHSISRHLGHHTSSLNRELKRNCIIHHYDVIQACALARERRRKTRRGSRLLPDSELFQVVTQTLRMGWSPQQISKQKSQDL